MSRRLALFASLVAFLSTPNVSAATETLGDTQIELIRQNCVAAQSNMQRLEQNETVTRRNRGANYESILKLMAAFNGRTAFNKLNVPNLVSITADVEKKKAEFNENYINYNNSLKVTMKLANCKEQPVTFYDYLTQTRELRVKLSTSIEDIDRLLDSYQTSLDNLKRSVYGFDATQGGGQ